MEFVGYELGVVQLGVLERKGLLQTSRRTIAEGREEVMFVDPGFIYSLFLICILFSFFPRVYSKYWLWLSPSLRLLRCVSGLPQVP